MFVNLLSITQMGGSSSKVELPETPNFDISSKATVPYLDVEQLQNQATTAYADVSNTAQQLISQNTSLSNEVLILSVVALVTTALIIYYYWGPISLWANSFGSYFNSNPQPQPSPEPAPTDTFKLNINSATVSSTKPTDDPKYHVPYDVTSQVVGLVGSESLKITVNESVSVQSAANPEDSDVLVIDYNYTGSSSQKVSGKYGDKIQIVFAGNGGKQLRSSKSTTTASSGLSDIKDAKIEHTIHSANGPATGPYGYQFWMYITDWNYKFGQDKHVFSRSDPSKTVSNPLVTLHPSDNSMKVSVSVYPNERTSKNEPAPVGQSGATDDVFICEIPNIPIQQWVAVSITVDTRSLDVYLNGKLVKSCQLSGIPKPAMGDIILNENGGFAGWMCSFNSYSKLLQPVDTQLFYSSGSPCKIPGDGSYSTKFGFFNTEGKQVSKYVF
jgi:hypothetical protein